MQKRPQQNETEGEGNGTGQALRRELEPHVEAAQDHEDQTGGDDIHRISPKGSERPVPRIARVIHLHAGKGMKRFDDPPDVDLRLAHVDAFLREIGLEEKEMARTPNLELEKIGICTWSGLGQPGVHEKKGAQSKDEDEGAGKQSEVEMKISNEPIKFPLIETLPSSAPGNLEMQML